MSTLSVWPYRFKDATGHIKYKDDNNVQYDFEDQSTQKHPRTRTLHLMASKLKPNTRYYITLDGKDVGRYLIPCKYEYPDDQFQNNPVHMEENGAKGDDLISTETGYLHAKLVIPGRLTVVGSHVLEMSVFPNAPRGSSYIATNRAFDVEFKPEEEPKRKKKFKRVSPVNKRTP